MDLTSQEPQAPPAEIHFVNRRKLLLEAVRLESNLFFDACQKRPLEQKEFFLPDRARRAARPRQVLMYLLRDILGLSQPKAGEFVGRDHTTVISAERKIAALSKDADFGAFLERTRVRYGNMLKEPPKVFETEPTRTETIRILSDALNELPEEEQSLVLAVSQGKTVLDIAKKSGRRFNETLPVLASLFKNLDLSYPLNTGDKELLKEAAKNVGSSH